jgi:copper chaperone CopZ
MSAKLEMTIEGMHCGGCVKRVTLALQKVDGVEGVSVDVGSAKVTYDADKTQPQVLEDAVNRIGFTAHAV